MIRSAHLLLLLLLVAALPASSPASAAATAEAQTFTGVWVWEEGEETGELSAVFTPAGDQHWNVAFHFKFQGSDHTYSGTADGALGKGRLSGRVESERKGAEYTFQGEFLDGRFQGRHARIEGRTEKPTGTLSLGK